LIVSDARAGALMSSTRGRWLGLLAAVVVFRNVHVGLKSNFQKSRRAQDRDGALKEPADGYV